MKIGILGAGAMGILFGGSLNKAGYDVKLIMRNRSKIETINNGGIKINLDNETYRVYPKATTPDESNNFDLILVFTKTNDTITALESIKKFAKPASQGSLSVENDRLLAEIKKNTEALNQIQGQLSMQEVAMQKQNRMLKQQRSIQHFQGLSRMMKVLNN